MLDINIIVILVSIYMVYILLSFYIYIFILFSMCICKQYIVEFCVFSQPDNLYLLASALSPFTFNIIMTYLSLHLQSHCVFKYLFLYIFILPFLPLFWLFKFFSFSSANLKVIYPLLFFRVVLYSMTVSLQYAAEYKEKWIGYSFTFQGVCCQWKF